MYQSLLNKYQSHEFQQPNVLLGSDQFQNEIETKLTNDYIDNKTISITKLIGDNQLTLLYTNNDYEIQETKNIDSLINTQSINQDKIIDLQTDLQNIINMINAVLPSHTANTVLQTDSSNNLLFTTINSNVIGNIVIGDIQGLNNALNSKLDWNLAQHNLHMNNKDITNIHDLINASSTYTTTNNSHYITYYQLNTQFPQLTYLQNNYYDKTYINNNVALLTNVYTKTQVDNLLLSYPTLTYLSINYYSQTESNNIYYNKTYIDSNYYTVANTYSQSQVNNLLNNYITLSYLTTNYKNNTELASLLLNYYAKNQNLDLQGTYKIINSPNPLNNQDLVTLSYLNTNFLSKSQYNTDNAAWTYDYSYQNLVDQTSGLLRLNSLTGPSSTGTYYLQCIQTAGPINTFSWQNTNNFQVNLYNTFNSSANTPFLQLNQTTNPTGQTIPITIEFIASNSNVAENIISMGYNSTGYFGVTNLGAKYGFLYNGSSNLRIFTKNASNTVDTALLIGNNVMQFYRGLNLNSNVINSSGNIFINNGSSLNVNTINANTTTDITINNDINLTSKLLKNYDLDYRTMDAKTTSGIIAQQVTTNNTFASWAVVDGTSSGIGMGLSRDNSGVYSCYLSTNKDFIIGNNTLTYLKIPYSTTQTNIYTQNGNIDLSVDTGATANVSGILFTNLISKCASSVNNNISVTGNFNMQTWTIFCNNFDTVSGTTINMGANILSNLLAPTASSHAVNKNYADNSIVVTTNRISTSTNGMPDNVRLLQTIGTADVSLFTDKGQTAGVWNSYTRLGWKSTHTTQPYIRYLTISNDRLATIQSGTPGVELFEIYRNSNTLAAYCSSTGQWITASDLDLKHSLRNKCNSGKDYLERIKNLNIYSYCFKSDNIHEHNEVQIGVIYQEVKQLFNNNICATRKKAENYQCCQDCETCNKKKQYYGEEIKAVNYQELFLYHILAFQQYVKKTDDTIQKQQQQIDELKELVKQLINKS